MADPNYDDLETDIENIGKFANDPAGTVTPREGEPYKNLRKIVADAGLQVLALKTWAELQPIVPATANAAAEIYGDTGTHNDSGTTNPVSNSGRFTFKVGTGWVRIGDALTTLGTIKSASIGGDLATGAPIAQGSWLTPPAAGNVVNVNNALIAKYGVKKVIIVPPGTQVGISCQLDRIADIGDYVIGTVIVNKLNAPAYPTTDFAFLGTVPLAGGTQQAFTPNNGGIIKTEDLSANIRRYVFGGKLTTVNGALASAFIFISNPANAPGNIEVSGFGIAASSVFYSDIDIKDYDPYGKAAARVRLTKAESDILGLKASNLGNKGIPAGGNLPNGAPAYYGSWLVPPAAADLVVATDALLKRLGIKYEVHVPAAADGGVYFRVDVPVEAINGDFVAGGVIVRKPAATPWTAFTDAFFTISCVPPDNGTQNGVSVTNGATLTYQDLSANIRRYIITDDLVTLSSALSWVIVFPHAIASTEYWASGLAFATSHNAIGDIDWLDFDPYSLGLTDKRLDVLEAAVNVGAPQLTPKLLIPSSIPVIDGFPLIMYSSRMTEYGSATTYKFAAIGRGALSEAIRWSDDKQLFLEGERLAGAGSIGAFDGSKAFDRPVNFRRSAAAKNGPWKVLTIGDSLGQQGQTGIMSAYLNAALVNDAQMLGTFRETNGVLGETRASWAAQTYVGMQTAVNSDGSGVITPVTDWPAYLALATPFGTPNDDYGPRWSKNPFLRAATGSDPAANVFGGYIFDFQNYLTKSGQAVPDAVDILLLMNDYLRGFTVADSMKAIDIMVKSIRAVSANIHIAFGCYSLGNNAAHIAILPYTKAILATYGGLEAQRFYVLPLWAMADPDLGYTMTAGAADAMGNRALTHNDDIHPVRNGPNHAAWAKLRFAHHMSLIAA